MNYVDPDEETARTIQQNQAYTDHQACFIPKDFRKKEPHCIICSMEESVWRKVIEKKQLQGKILFATDEIFGNVFQCRLPNNYTHMSPCYNLNEFFTTVPWDELLQDSTQ